MARGWCRTSERAARRRVQEVRHALCATRPSAIASWVRALVEPGYQLARGDAAIAEELFVGNRLENGEVVVDGHCRTDLKRIGAPLVIFAPTATASAAATAGAGLAEGSVCRDRGPGGCRPACRLPAAKRVGNFRHLHCRRAWREREHPRHPCTTPERSGPCASLYEMVLDDAATGDSATAARFEPRRLEGPAVRRQPGWIRQGAGAVRAAERAYAMGLAVGAHGGRPHPHACCANCIRCASASRVWSKGRRRRAGVVAVDAAVGSTSGGAHSDRKGQPWYQRWSASARTPTRRRPWQNRGARAATSGPSWCSNRSMPDDQQADRREESRHEPSRCRHKGWRFLTATWLLLLLATMLNPRGPEPDGAVRRHLYWGARAGRGRGRQACAGRTARRSAQGGGQVHHLVVALYDSASDRRIGDAVVRAQLAKPASSTSRGVPADEGQRPGQLRAGLRRCKDGPYRFRLWVRLPSRTDEDRVQVLTPGRRTAPSAEGERQ